MSYINQLTLLDGTTVDLEAKSYDGEPIPVAKGGTGASTAQLARQMLGLGSASTMVGSNRLINNDEVLPTGSAVMDYVGYYLDMRLRGWTHNQTNFVYGKESVFPGFNSGNIAYNFTSSVAQPSVTISDNYKTLSFNCGHENDSVTWEVGTESGFAGHTLRFMFDIVDTVGEGGAKISFIAETSENVKSVIKTFIGDDGNTSDYENTDTSVVLGDSVCIDYEFPSSFYNFYIVFGHVLDSNLSDSNYDTLNIVNFNVFDITGVEV